MVKFRQSAFKHGITEADIRHAFETMKYDAQFDEPDTENTHLLIGFDRNANLIEVLYNPIDANSVRVFHAMKCRNSFLALLD